MASGKFGDKLEELDLSHEEIDRLTKCMKDEKFRDLLREYAEEISDPENRKRYEEEIALLEKDRGMDVKFINPKPGHVLKTSINGSQKCFINICTNENLGKPRSRPSMQGNTRGMQWSIPHSVSQAREDVDKAGTKCMVYDVVIHPDTYYLLKKNERFKKMIHDTALDAVERQFGVELDKVNVRTPKMAFKGLPMSSVIRTPHRNGAPEVKNSTSIEDVDVKLRPPFPPDDIKANGIASGNTLTTASKPKPGTKGQPFPNLKEEAKRAKQMKEKAKNGEPGKEEGVEWGFTEPEYSIMHRGHFDIQDYRIGSDVVHDTWPKELVINIDLPLLSAANCVNLEIFERHLHLDSIKPAKYKLDFELPYPVAENKGFAKFDKSKHRLTVTLEVLPAPPPPKLLPFTSPPLVAEVEEDHEHTGSTTAKETQTTEKHNGEPQQPLTNGTPHANKVGIEESSASGDYNEATETTAETLMTESNAAAKTKQGKKAKTSESNQVKKPTFVEDGRRHYQEGTNWKDNDDLEEDNPNIDAIPLTKNSAFLIDMVMKYEGLIRRCPQYAFQQDEHYVSFIIEVPHIFEESLWYAVYTNMLQFCCLSECLDDDMVNSVFQLWIEFGDDCRIDPQRSRVDVSGNNAVFCLRKIKSDKEWHVIRAGFDKDNLDIRRFSTARNVCDLYTLVYKHANGVTTNPVAVCKVVREEKDLLIIELEEQVENNEKNSDDHQVEPNKEQISSETAEEKECENIHRKINTPTEDDKERNKNKLSVAKTTNDESDHKKVSFSADVKKNAERRGETESDESSNQEQDSDDEEQEPTNQRRVRAEGIVTIGGADDHDREVITDHSTKSAVKLSSNSLIYAIDDDV